MIHKHFFNILRVNDPQSQAAAVVVCETPIDQEDVLRHAHNAGHKVTQVVLDTAGITLNDYEL